MNSTDLTPENTPENMEVVQEKQEMVKFCLSNNVADKDGNTVIKTTFVEVEKDIAITFGTVKNLMEDDLADSPTSKGQLIVPIANDNIDGKTMETVIEICRIEEEVDDKEPARTLHQGPIKIDPRIVKIFEDMDCYNDFNGIAKVILAFNYLDRRDKLRTVAAMIATILHSKMTEKGKTQEECFQSIRDYAGFPDDLTAEEKAKISEEIKWAYNDK